MNILYPTFLKNKKKIPKGRVILVSNHLSNVDPLLMAHKLWRKQHIMAKKQLFKGLTLPLMKAMQAIPTDRDNVELSTIKSCLKVLKDDKILTIFPEGTRKKDKSVDLLPIKDGAGIFSVKVNAPIVPVWFVKKPRLFRFNKIIFGEPFYITKEDMPNANQIIREKMLELKPIKK